MSEDEFLAAIADAPEDDTVRLVFADWLEERGQRKADFIRAEYALIAQTVGFPPWHEAFANYRSASEGLPELWRTTVGRYPLSHWLKVAARSAWVRLESWFERHHPQMLDSLGAGASATDIETLERTIGQTLPPDVRESFAIHNGGSEYPILGDNLLSTHEVIDKWESWRGLECRNEECREDMESFPENAIMLDYANSGWIPLTECAAPDYLGVDLAPGPAGIVGQVINFGRNERQKCVLASGWAEFLADFATFLESGAVASFDPDSSNLRDWYSDAIEDSHCHDILSRWRKDGRWPVRKQVEPEPVPERPAGDEQ